MQLLNITRGGTLHQHIPDLPGAANHLTPPGTQLEHPLDLDVGTRLSALVGAAAMTANTYHHQAVDALGAGLRVTAKATDGIVEAVEDTSHPFLVGVQWHPEALQHRAEHRRIFDAFVTAC
jgi:putative glutamine amidotransferase